VIVLDGFRWAGPKHGFESIMDLSIVIPCRNEDRALARLCHALASILPGMVAEYEIILVGGGSRILPGVRALAGSDPRFRYQPVRRGAGRESVIVAGLRRARGRRVAVMDADLRHPPAVLKRMLSLVEAGYDQVVARCGRGGGSLSRRLSVKFSRIVGTLVGVGGKEGIGDFRMLSRRAVDAVLLTPEGNLFEKGLFAWIGLATASISYRNGLSHAGYSTSKYGRTSRCRARRWSVCLELSVILLSCGSLGCVIVRDLCNAQIPGLTRLMAGIVGLGGLSVLAFGFAGGSMGKKYREARRWSSFPVTRRSSPRRVRGARGHRATGVSALPRPAVSAG
jgi:hypothetical protein